MKTFGIILCVMVSPLFAAEVPRDLTFTQKINTLPTLTLSDSVGRTSKTLFIKPAGTWTFRAQPAPAAPTDLIAPAARQQKVIDDFRSGELAPKADGAAAKSDRKDTVYYPIASPDLIGPSSDREKLIRDFKARTEENRPKR